MEQTLHILNLLKQEKTKSNSSIRILKSNSRKIHSCGELIEYMGVPLSKKKDKQDWVHRGEKPPFLQVIKLNIHEKTELKIDAQKQESVYRRTSISTVWAVPWSCRAGLPFAAVVIVNWFPFTMFLKFYGLYQVSPSGWSEGECKGKAGWFPSAYVEKRQRIPSSNGATEVY